jgi:hypothetical protein
MCGNGARIFGMRIILGLYAMGGPGVNPRPMPG